ncbi:MAG: NDP-hexose 3-C-methyltransferase protein [Geminicoccaceae bacterium]|nr:NDP-hexose 3-C-methyltransferase protein [Geminicoccaceae bacterium]
MLAEPQASLEGTSTSTAGPCRFCGAGLRDVFVDLGMSPLCESYLAADQLNRMEPFYPLRVFVCRQCLLVQLQEYVSPVEIFTEYAYFSSYSSAWLAHAETYAGMIGARLGLGRASLVVELASNDGYLLQYFVGRGIPVLGVEPARNVAAAAEARGVPTRVAFFDAVLARRLAAEGKAADLIVANNVLAQVPDLNSFVAGMRDLLKPLAAERIFAAHGLTLFDVEELWTHGGSLRLYLRHAADPSRPVSARARALRASEVAAGYADPGGAPYAGFEERARATKRRLLALLIEAKQAGRSIAGYGAPGKGNTLLNYCGIRADFLDFTVDRNPYKQGKFLPGSHVPIHPPGRLDEARPDYVLILPWNLKDEIIAQLAHARSWGARFVVPIPEPLIC